MKAGLSRLFRSLKHRSYRIFFLGQFVSLVGMWVQTTVQGWLVYRLTGSAQYLGFVGFGGQAPMVIFALAGGVLADRVDRRKALMVTQTLAMLLASLLGFLAVTGTVRPWHILALAVLAGIVAACDMPLRQSFVVELVGHEDLSNAIALNSSMFNLARVIGPALAGIAVGIVGEGVCILFNAVTYIPVIWALGTITATHKTARSTKSSPWSSLKEGVSHALAAPHLKCPLMLMGMTSLIIMPTVILMPVFTVKLLTGGPGTLGLLLSSLGLGALIGALSLAWRAKSPGLGSLVAKSAAVFGASILVFSWSKNVWLSSIALIFAGTGMMRQTAGCNTLIQSLVEDEFRGRIMSLFVMMFTGLSPLGSLLSGSLAESIGASWTGTLAGIWALAASVWFASRLSSMKEGEGAARSGAVQQPDAGEVVI